MEMIICQTCKEAKRPDAFYCRGLRSHPALCKKCRNKKRNQTPKAKEARRNYDKSEKAVARRRMKAQTPEAKEYQKMYHKKQEVKEKDRIYKQRPDVKEKRRARDKMPDRVSYRKKYMENPLVKERLNGYARQQRSDAADWYVKELIYKKTSGVLKFDDIPHELIDIQRQAIILKRTIKQKKQKNEQHTATNV